MKKKRSICILLGITMLLVFLRVPVYAETEEPSGLYAKAFVLMDGESGRVLFEKNGQEQLPMASTTKIMTCIVTLENGNLEDVVTFSKYASSMPDVQLNGREGEQFLLKDLLHSLMLESHNDSAVAIAEHIGEGNAKEHEERTVEESKNLVRNFTQLMNQKAKDIGCYDTFFVTPNGLDATATIQGEGDSAEVKVHSTTAADLARIMTYCIKQSPCKEQFLEITRASNYSFTNKITKEDGSIESGNRSFSCSNHNAFLTMMDGALSGKTGFTNNAGYCYVGALERDGKTFIISLLACGWPNHKTYKWSDTKKLMNYALENYEYRSFDEVEVDKQKLHPILVAGGQTPKIGDQAMVEVERVERSDALEKILLREDETIEVQYELISSLEAPVEKGENVGKIVYLVNGEVWKVDGIVTKGEVVKIDFKWCVERVLEGYLG